MLFSHTAMFTPVDLKRRIFKAVAKPNHRDRMLLLAQTGRDLTPTAAPNEQRLRDAAFDTEATAQLVTEPSGTIVAANARARETFGLTSKDLGRPLDDLELSYRPSDLRMSIERALNERREIRVADVPWTLHGDLRAFDIVITPLLGDDRSVLGSRISFQDVTELKALRIELQHSKQELETAYEELQSTNEELETTNEELQSTVEELETTNEELQSTNEELETMNEELQSTNEELHTTNEELRNRSSRVEHREWISRGGVCEPSVRGSRSRYGLSRAGVERSRDRTVGCAAGRGTAQAPHEPGYRPPARGPEATHPGRGKRQQNHRGICIICNQSPG